MIPASPLDEPYQTTCVPMPGLASDNLLAFMALLGLLRALDHARPTWHARARWRDRPWTAELLLEQDATGTDIAEAADTGITAIARGYRFSTIGDNEAPPRDVRFTADEFRRLVASLREDEVGAALTSALSAEAPIRRDGSVMAAPLVLLFGQGHQHFLDRLTTVPLQPAPPISGRARAPQPSGPTKLAEALFRPWVRLDTSDGFRWDPADDQRYALRFGDPSKEGAAGTEHGANRLAAIGLLSFPCVAGDRLQSAVASVRRDGRPCYLWPIWTEPLTLGGIETLLAQDLPSLDPAQREACGIAAVMRALRIPNGKFMNVTLAAET
jgi:hypothetical protein